jgi:DICT domain-containing protein
MPYKDLTIRREKDREYARAARHRDIEAYRAAHKTMPSYGRVYGVLTKEANNAKAAIRRALKRGQIVRPEFCQRCRRPAFVEAAHKDYSPERRLDVEWLCRPCHRTEDAWNPKGGRVAEVA